MASRLTGAENLVGKVAVAPSSVAAAIVVYSFSTDAGGRPLFARTLNKVVWSVMS